MFYAECGDRERLPNCDDGEGGVAYCVGAGEGEDFIELFADGGFEDAVADAVDEGYLQSFAGEVCADYAFECVELELKLLAFGYISAAGECLYMEVDCESAVRRWLEEVG